MSFRKEMMSKYFSHTTIDDVKYGTYKQPHVQFNDLTRCLNQIDNLEQQLTQKDAESEKLRELLVEACDMLDDVEGYSQGDAHMISRIKQLLNKGGDDE